MGQNGMHQHQPPQPVETKLFLSLEELYKGGPPYRQLIGCC